MGASKFGCAGAVETDTHSFMTDQLEYRDGFDTDLFSLKFTDSIRRGNPSYCAQAYGIGKSDDHSRNSLGVALERVTKAEEEEITTPHMKATKPEEIPVLGDKLTYTDGMIFHRKKITITITGKGEPPAGLNESNRGDTFAGPLTIKPAVGDHPDLTISEEDLYIARVELAKTSTDFWKFTIELTKYVGNTVDKALENMIVPTLFTVVELDDISPWYKLSRSTTLNFNDKPNVEETAEIYDAVATP